MPTYQYACTECDHAFEQVQSFSDASLTVCPSCGGKLRKIYGAVGVTFKGSGFYKTDSAAKPASSPASTPATSTDSKPAASSPSSSSSSSE